MRPCEHFKKKIDSHSHLNPQDLTLNSQNKLSRTESRLENQVLSFKTKVLSQEIKWTNCHLTISLELGSNSSWNTPHSFMKYTHCPAFFCDETKFALSKRILTQRASQTANKIPCSFCAFETKMQNLWL